MMQWSDRKSLFVMSRMLFGAVAYKPIKGITKFVHLYVYMLFKVMHVHNFLHAGGVWMP